MLDCFSTFVFNLEEISVLEKFLHFAAAPSILQIKVTAFSFQCVCRTELIHKLKCIICYHSTFAGPQSSVLRRHFIVPVHGSVTLFITQAETCYRVRINCATFSIQHRETDFILNKLSVCICLPHKQKYVENGEKKINSPNSPIYFQFLQGTPSVFGMYLASLVQGFVVVVVVGFFGGFFVKKGREGHNSNFCKGILIS